MSYSKLLISLFLFTAVICEAQTAPLPQIRQNGSVKQFFVDNKPFIMLAANCITQAPPVSNTCNLYGQTCRRAP